MFFNTNNTTYFIAKELNGVDKITSIGIYRNRGLKYNIDLDDVRGLHFHKWDIAMVRGGKS